MSPVDAPDTLTPLMRLRRKRRALWLFGVLLFVGVGLLAGLVLSVNHGRNFERLVAQLDLETYLLPSRQAPPTSQQRYRRPSRLSLVPPRLIAASATETDGFRTSPSLTAQERCLDMGREGAESPSFQEMQDGWECVLSLDLGDTDEPSVIFIQARGASTDTFRTFRAKLSFLAPDQDAALIGLTLDSIDQFGMNLSPESRRYVEDLLVDKRDASSLLENYRIAFEQERGDDRRFNLLITPRPSTAQCPDPSNGIPGARLQSSTFAIPLGCLGVPASSRLLLFGPVQTD